MMKPLRSLAGLFAVSLALSCLNVGGSPSWPSPGIPSVLVASLQPSEPAASDDRAIVKELPVCIASSKWSAGELGRTVLYHARREGRTLKVGYFAYWTTERPWGQNALSYAVLPALFIDAFYSHLLFMFPGAQYFIHGPGDIEGARVTYEQRDDGQWVPVAAVADDGSHHEVELSPDDFIDAYGRVVLMTGVWSHQLGAKGARTFAERRGDELSCFDGDSLAPLTPEVASAFRLGSPTDPRRAPPAWKLDVPGERKLATLEP
jgi:hypothetical protein